MAIIFSLLMSIGLINGSNINTQDKPDRTITGNDYSTSAKGGFDWDEMH